MILSIVIPVKDDNRVFKSLIVLSNILKSIDLSYEILVVGHLDDSHKLPKNIIFVKTSRSTKGYCLKQGVKRSHGKYILFCDADLPVGYFDLQKLFNSIDDSCDVFLFNRQFLSKKKALNRNHKRELLSRLFHISIGFLFNLRKYDTQCGIKLIRKEILIDLLPRLKCNGFVFDVELLFLLSQKEYKILQQQIINYEYGTSSLNLLFVIPQILYELICLFIRIKILRLSP